LLEDLVEAGKIRARTKWKEIYPLFSGDERYLSMLGNPGSNPLELFWDLVDNLDQKLDEKIAVVEETILAHNTRLSANGGPSDGTKAFAVGPTTTEEEFMMVVKEYLKDGENTLGDGDLHSVFETVCTMASIGSAALTLTRASATPASCQETVGRDTANGEETAPFTG
jgi:pre-mRNA-processing factor 40